MNKIGDHPDRPGAYEMKDASIRWVVIIGIGSALAVVVMAVTLMSYFTTTRETIYYEQVLKPVPVEVLEFRRTQDSVLNSYELIDAKKGTYRVPIERAMELIADEVGGTPTGN